MCIIDSEEKRIKALKQFEIGDVWESDTDIKRKWSITA